ncbi:MAG: nitroreductase [Clostridiales bacterium]|nr:nitroreductase [Clostridiales bacterium]
MIKEIQSRKSVRVYKDKDVEDKLIMGMIEAARLAPSGNNTQPWTFIIVRTKEMKEKIASADGNQKWMLTAPVFIVCVADIKCRVKDTEGMALNDDSPEAALKKVIRDTSIAVEHLVLEGQHLGLATCWTGWFEQEDMRQVLGIPSDKYVLAVVTVGYAGETKAAPKKKALEKIVKYEKW